MKRTILLSLIALTWLWIGLTTGLSFIEAPLKFQAPGITLPLGLGIGRLVFGTLVRIELAFALFVMAALFSLEKWKQYWFFAIPILITFIDFFYLLPRLDERAQIIIDGGTPPESSLHWIYVILEVVKLLSLLTCGIYLLRKNIISTSPDLQSPKAL